MNITKEKLLELELKAISQEDLLKLLNMKNHVKNRNILKELYKSFKLEYPNYKNSIFLKIEKELLIDIVNHSNNYTEVLSAFKKSDRGSNISDLKKVLDKYNINTSHFGSKKIKIPNINNKTIFSKDSIISTSVIKRKILNLNLIEYKCSCCNQKPFWKGKELVLILDHINGINNDNRLENLRFVCPNCDSQLETFGTRNKNKVKDIPSKIDIEIFKIKQYQKYNFGKIIKNFHTNYIPVLLTESILFNFKKTTTKVKLSNETKIYINDFRKQRIQFICSDCEKELVQPTKYCSKCFIKHSRKVKERPTLIQLYSDLEELNTYINVGKKYNVSDRTIKDWIEDYGGERKDSDFIRFEKKIKEINDNLKNNIEILSHSYKNYGWIQHVRNENKKNNLSKEKLDLIKQYKLPLFEAKSPKEILEERKKEYISFVKKSGRKPTTKNVNEKKLVQWLVNTKKRYFDVYNQVLKEIEQYL